MTKRRSRAHKRTLQRPALRRDAAGRVHLALHRDGDGNDYLTLTAPVFKHEWQNALAAGAANTVRGTLRGQPSLERVVELARNAMAATSRVAEGLLSQAAPGSVACRAGCDHCCYQVVGVTPPEALAILHHLEVTRSAGELEALRTHVTELYERGRGRSSEQRFSPDFPCAFLDVKSGRCTIYEVRPLSCRGMNSLDAGECARRLREPAARAEFLAAGAGGHTFLEPIRAFHAVSAGLQIGASELYRLDMRPLELTAALHLLLTEPRSIVDDWLRGQHPFESARSSDLSRDAGMRELSGR